VFNCSEYGIALTHVHAEGRQLKPFNTDGNCDGVYFFLNKVATSSHAPIRLVRIGRYPPVRVLGEVREYSTGNLRKIADWPAFPSLFPMQA
jgi:hypothetical protein